MDSITSWSGFYLCQLPTPEDGRGARVHIMPIVYCIQVDRGSFTSATQLVSPTGPRWHYMCHILTILLLHVFTTCHVISVAVNLPHIRQPIVPSVVKTMLVSITFFTALMKPCCYGESLSEIKYFSVVQNLSELCSSYIYKNPEIQIMDFYSS